MSPSKMMPRETQVKLVMKLLERNGEHSANQIRKRAAKGEGVTAKGVEFDLSILNEALATWDAQHCQAAPAESPHKKKMPPAASPKKKSSKRKCASADDRRDPAKAAKTCTPKPSVGDRVDENTSGASATPASSPTGGKKGFAASVPPGVGISESKIDSAEQNKAPDLPRAAKGPSATEAMQVARAVGLVREAKEACERSLSRQEAPLAPRRLWHETLSSVPGQRRFKLHWTPPEDRVSAPISRYVVAVFDPAYGRALTIAILEPDYSEESRSFVGIESLTAFEFSEEDFQKMPKLWKQTSANVQVAAANKAGQSAWATLQVPLDSATSLSKTLYRASTASVDFHSSAVHKPEDLDMRAWDAQLRKLRGEELRAWLEPQKKAVMAVWLKSMNWFAQGSKNDILERVIFIREAMPS